MKKLLSLLLALAMTMSLAACGEKKDAEDANADTKQEEKVETKDDTTDESENIVWEGYSDVDFQKFLEDGLNKLYDGECDVTVKSEKGWINTEEFNEADVSEGKSPVTYVIDVHHIENNEDMSFYFYMELQDKTLSTHGATAVYSADSSSNLNAEEAYSMLEDVINYYEYDENAEATEEQVVEEETTENNAVEGEATPDSE